MCRRHRDDVRLRTNGMVSSSARTTFAVRAGGEVRNGGRVTGAEWSLLIVEGFGMAENGGDE